MNISLDIETLGTNVDSQILSIGACKFDKDGNILAKNYSVIRVSSDATINATMGTIKFWLTQSASKHVFDSKIASPMSIALTSLRMFIQEDDEVWANGTKFDLGMLEYQYKLMGTPVPWKFNADRCMRTLRKFAGHIDIDFEGVQHNALDDAIWQAKYIAAACKKLGLEL
ncbi:MAG: 3'-5' exoribonuclease [Pseudoalteromonas sp.]|uniref:3'-5' exonuclease n=1 Tax=Pseudoalteromonas sp. TaxID=53249 RepID=UPI001D40B269|nr:3'-5' exonuclease [Pseudoalteromonas sp.]NRA77913.1 3'-5' exoribonuclease [Pseudoalteromonas sp.]